jgi:hypothetical protein
MSWRTTQLGNQLCEQDKLIVSLFDNKDVNYIGVDFEFQQMLEHNPDSENVVLILSTPGWVSDIVAMCRQHLSPSVRTFYIGINRYQVLGNDTTNIFNTTENPGADLISLLTDIVLEQGFTVTKSGHFDRDLGRYFNFVQPLTWVYGHNVTNRS